MGHGAAARLGAGDFRAILNLLADTRELDLETPYSAAFVNHLDALIEGDVHPLYRENDLVGRRTPLMIDGEGRQEDDADELYWTVGPCAITQYRSATGDLSAARLTDVVSWRRYRESAIYREYFGPGGVGYMLDLGLTTAGTAADAPLLQGRGREGLLRARPRRPRAASTPSPGSRGAGRAVPAALRGWRGDGRRTRRRLVVDASRAGDRLPGRAGQDERRDRSGALDHAGDGEEASRARLREAQRERPGSCRQPASADEPRDRNGRRRSMRPRQAS